VGYDDLCSHSSYSLSVLACSDRQHHAVLIPAD
jgi:hypothetical protein